jgi:uncharacterized protein involved in copper resistance
MQSGDQTFIAQEDFMKRLNGIGASGLAVAAMLLASQPLLAADTSGKPRADTGVEADTTAQGSADTNATGASPTDEGAHKQGRHHHRMHHSQHAKSGNPSSTGAGESTGSSGGADETGDTPK